MELLVPIGNTEQSYLMSHHKA